MPADMCQKRDELWHLLSRCREFQRTCSTSKRASGSHVGSSFTMTLTKCMQSYWAASWLAGKGALESPGLLNSATCQEWTNHLGTLRQLCCYNGSDIRSSLCNKQAASMQLHPRPHQQYLTNAACAIALLSSASLHKQHWGTRMCTSMPVKRWSSQNAARTKLHRPMGETMH